MKKVKITPKAGSPGTKFFLFPSPEALYVWASRLEQDEQIAVDGIDEILLQPGGFIEAELTGYEFVYDNTKTLKNIRLDRVRLGLAQRPKNAAGLEVSIHAGWVTDTLLPMRPYANADIDVCVLELTDERLDLPTLFNDEIPVTTDD